MIYQTAGRRQGKTASHTDLEIHSHVVLWTKKVNSQAWDLKFELS